MTYPGFRLLGLRSWEEDSRLSLPRERLPQGKDHVFVIYMPGATHTHKLLSFLNCTWSRQSRASQPLLGICWSSSKQVTQQAWGGAWDSAFLTGFSRCWPPRPLKGRALERPELEEHSNKLCSPFSRLLEFSANSYFCGSSIGLCPCSQLNASKATWSCGPAGIGALGNPESWNSSRIKHKNCKMKTEKWFITCPQNATWSISLIVQFNIHATSITLKKLQVTFYNFARIPKYTEMWRNHSQLELTDLFMGQ